MNDYDGPTAPQQQQFSASASASANINNYDHDADQDQKSRMERIKNQCGRRKHLGKNNKTNKVQKTYACPVL